ncbi:MAG: phospho-N-acetylmuramoyl-pentapeptide-transferase [Thermoguttaceae bacterium]|jgi:phospho-N-acetylmuramoyl-pentapeptide-transferase|nr:phospho-N-acetylmuramoyl-pentapeptide-transferase [Thermoguttaceae bacterium]
MLLSLLDFLTDTWAEPALAGLAKITLRAALAALASFLVAVVVGPRWIGWLRARFREPILCDSEAVRRLHEHKSATPTMGGLFIVAGLAGATCLMADLSNLLVQAALLLVVGLGLVGAVDDLVKLRGTRNGLSVRSKFAAQLVVATLVAVLIWEHHRHLPDGLVLALPLWGQVGNLGIAFIPLAVLVLVGSSNAVNLTDGLDGLAGGCLIFTTAAMAAVTYAAGHAEMAQYLAIPRIPGAGELTVPAAALVGGVMGFLWFNCHPAQVFMGDTGALPLGGLLGLLALAARQEWLLVVVGGVFVAEAGSVILQVGSFKLRRKRIFRCAPLHHHFQLLGWPENKIVVRFWIAGALCALAGLAALKLNIDDSPHPALPPSAGWVAPAAKETGSARAPGNPTLTSGGPLRQDLLTVASEGVQR